MPEPYNNEMRFALFTNDKQGNENRPDMRGTMQVAGVEYEISAWCKISKSGAKFMSGQIQPKRDRQAPPPQREQPTAADVPKAYDNGESEIPL